MSTVPASHSTTPAGSPTTAVRVPLTQPASPEAAVAAVGANLADLDQQLAADLDQMLQGEFDPIDKVLDEVFDEKAAIVQRAGGMPAEQNPRQHAATVLPNAPPKAEQHVMLAANSPPIPQPEALKIAPVAEAPPINVMVAAPEQTTVVAPPTAMSKEAASTPVVAAVESHVANPEKPMATVGAAASAAIASVSPAPSTPKSSTVIHPIVRLMMMLNAPLRMLPRSLQPIINLTAITLVLWVPLVWVLAVLHRGHAPDEASHTTGSVLSAISHDEKLHGDSTITSSESASH